jgi:threonine/homoserine efflux transporter RhtA
MVADAAPRHPGNAAIVGLISSVDNSAPQLVGMAAVISASLGATLVHTTN